jgi:hypothetical protein
MARTINATATNAANAMLSITPTIRILLGSDFMLNKYRLDAEIAHDIFIVDIVSTDAYLLAHNTMWGISTHSRE